MSDLISKKYVVAELLKELEQYPPMVAERYSLGVKMPHSFNMAMRGGIRKGLRIAETAPAVDAVEVVRCKDCKHRGFAGECPMCYTEDAYDEDYGYDYWDVDKTVDKGFCHCGEKWDGEASNNA